MHVSKYRMGRLSYPSVITLFLMFHCLNGQRHLYSLVSFSKARRINIHPICIQWRLLIDLQRVQTKSPNLLHNSPSSPWNSKLKPLKWAPSRIHCAQFPFIKFVAPLSPSCLPTFSAGCKAKNNTERAGQWRRRLTLAISQNGFRLQAG